ncbi:hypothetical protein KBQ18_08275 [Klebsiella aerogenes]|nr:hypothetical protein [Klebsiella aerogenes]MCT2805457.1 hypothetical protein [Klebsiella aerogenes]MCT2811777.1 hypothetical protein [Klebsiella aerogenes]MCT2848254.1 hypothetical protein [Klebsiella aerogenes]QLS46444.1 hypothetical protein HV316_19780 [Klebsiella aerogenes]
MNDVSYATPLSLQPVYYGIPVNFHPFDYQLNDRPAYFSCDERCAVFQ